MTSLMVWAHMPSLLFYYDDFTWKVLKYKTVTMTIISCHPFRGIPFHIGGHGYVHSHNWTLACGDVVGHTSRMQDLLISMDKLFGGGRSTVISYKDIREKKFSGIVDGDEGNGILC